MGDQNIIGSNGLAHPPIAPQQLPMIDQQSMVPNNPVGDAAVEQRGYMPQPPQPAQYPEGLLQQQQQQQQYQIQQMQRQQQMQQQLSMQGSANMYPQVSGQMACAPVGSSGMMMGNMGNFQQQQMQSQQAQMTYQQQMPQMQQMQQMQHAQQHQQTLPQQMNQSHQAQMLQQQQQHQQYQQHQQQSRVRKPWHATDNSDNAIRTQMAQKIIHILHQKRPNANTDWKQKLPHMAKRLEEALYLNANSKEEYQNLNTVKIRLQQYAMSVGNRQNQQQQQQQQQQQMFLKQQAGGASNTVVQQPQAGLYPQGNMGYNRPPGVGMASQFAHSSSVPHSNYQGSDGSKTGSHTNGSSSSGTTSGNERSDAHRSQVLKQQQQRLLLLRHASKCSKTDCEVTQHCASMKELWEHIMNCKDQQCRKPHCVSSRYVLSHYSKCKETKCPVCGPVRDAILEHYNNKNNTQPPAKSQGGGATATGKKGS